MELDKHNDWVYSRNGVWFRKSDMKKLPTNIIIYLSEGTQHINAEQFKVRKYISKTCVVGKR